MPVLYSLCHLPSPGYEILRSNRKDIPDRDKMLREAIGKEYVGYIELTNMRDCWGHGKDYYFRPLRN